MRTPLPVVAMVVWSSLAASAGAQVVYLQNDSYGGGAVLCYQGITLFRGLASKFTALPSQYPYTINRIRVFGCAGGADAYVIQIFQDNGSTAAPGTLIWSSQNAYFLSGNNTFNDILLASEPIQPPPITTGSIRVLLVNDSILTPIGFGADLNGIQPMLNTIRDDVSVWSFAENPPYNVGGDWILRLGINAALQPTLNAIDVSVTETTGGSTDAVFTVSLSPTATSEVTVAYATADGTAVSPDDYAATSGVLTFPPGTGVRTVVVPVVGDALDEPTETFTLNLSGAVSAAIGDGSAIGTIIDNDAPVAVSVADAATVEGDGGMTALSFPVTLSAPSGFPVTVGYATANGTAVAPGDFTATSGTLTLPAGTTASSLDVTIVGDLEDEVDETFGVSLSSPTNATLADPTATGTILDDDTALQQALAHGTVWTGSLASHPGPTAATHLFAFPQEGNASYEVIVDAASGDLGSSGPLLERYDFATSSVIQASTPVGVGFARSLRWANASTSPVTSQGIRVRSGQCTTDCGADDTYRLRSWDTTLRGPRFNNAGSQVTVLQLENTSGEAVAGAAHFWSESGTLLTSHAFTLPVRGSLSLVTSTVAGLAGASGSLTITHNAPYGALMGKAIALEPATGMTFDSVLEPRPR